MTMGFARWTSSATPAPQYASPSPQIPSSVSTRTSTHGKFPAITAVRTSVIFTKGLLPVLPVADDLAQRLAAGRVLVRSGVVECLDITKGDERSTSHVRRHAEDLASAVLLLLRAVPGG